MRKKLEKKETFEETLKLYKRYIQICCQRINRDELIDDLVSEANIGLLTAYNEFDNSKGSFHSFAASHIKYSILNYITNNSRTIRLPSSIQNATKYRHKMETIKKTISLNTPIDEEGNDTLEDTIECNNYPNDYDNTNDVIRDVLKNYLSQMSIRHQYLLKARYMEEKTLSEIAEELELTREAVRLQLGTAMKKIRKLMNIEVIDDKYLRVNVQKRKKDDK